MTEQPEIAAHGPELVQQLGRTDVLVPRLGLGTAPLGGLFEAVSDEEAETVIRAAFATGIPFFDTAPLYGYGLAESRLGDVLHAEDRSRFVLATKVGRLLRADAPVDPAQLIDGEPFFKGAPALRPVFDFSYDGVMRSVEESLERLRVTSFDILHIHDPDDHFDDALSGAYVALDRLRAEGTVAAVGAGMTQTEMLVRFAKEADFDCFLLAGRYSLLDHSGARALLDICSDRTIGVIVGGVFNSGILASAVTKRATFDYARAPEDVVARARRLAEVCGRHDVPLKAAALQFPFGSPAVTSVLVGCRSVAELEEDVRLSQFEIPPDLWGELKAEGLVADWAIPEERR